MMMMMGVFTWPASRPCDDARLHRHGRLLGGDPAGLTRVKTGSCESSSGWKGYVPVYAPRRACAARAYACGRGRQGSGLGSGRRALREDSDGPWLGRALGSNKSPRGSALAQVSKQVSAQAVPGDWRLRASGVLLRWSASLALAAPFS